MMMRARMQLGTKNQGKEESYRGGRKKPSSASNAGGGGEQKMGGLEGLYERQSPPEASGGKASFEPDYEKKAPPASVDGKMSLRRKEKKKTNSPILGVSPVLARSPKPWKQGQEKDLNFKRAGEKKRESNLPTKKKKGGKPETRSGRCAKAFLHQKEKEKRRAYNCWRDLVSFL